jgi:hypothetical protein
MSRVHPATHPRRYGQEEIGRLIPAAESANLRPLKPRANAPGNKMIYAAEAQRNCLLSGDGSIGRPTVSPQKAVGRASVADELIE